MLFQHSLSLHLFTYLVLNFETARAGSCHRRPYQAAPSSATSDADKSVASSISIDASNWVDPSLTSSGIDPSASSVWSDSTAPTSWTDPATTSSVWMDPSLSTDPALAYSAVSTSAPNNGGDQDADSSDGQSNDYPVVAAAINLGAPAGPSSTSVTAANPPQNTASSSGNSPKAGLGLNGDSGTHDTLSAFTGSGISWYYNWAPAPASPDQLPELEYVPMLHGTKDQTLTEFTKAKDSFASRGVKAVMSFNEPNKGDDAATGGSNVSPTDAAAKHQEYLNDLPYDIVAPAVSQGGDDWWRRWQTACNGNCRYEIVPFHWYGTTGDLFRQDLEKFVNGQAKGNRVWITEWACIDYSNPNSPIYCNAQDSQKLMDDGLQAIKDLGVERYQWQGVFQTMAGNQANKLLNADGTLNDLGYHYKSIAP